MTVAVLMGVSGSGKTTIARQLAAREHWEIQEGDSLHPAANIEKMSHGIALDDADRLPWLQAIAAVIDRWLAGGVSGAVACSALKRSYRDILIGPRSDVVLVYLQGSQQLIARRLAARHDHFMPPALLDSQFATLEEPGPDEHPIVVSIAPPPEAILETLMAKLRARGIAA